MGTIHVIQEACITQSEKERKLSNQIRIGDKDSTMVEDENSIESLQLSLCRSIDIINETDAPDPYLSSVCAIVKRIILSEVQQRDLELISSIIIFTFNTKGINSNSVKKNDMKEKEKEKEKEKVETATTNSRSGSSSRVRISSVTEGAGVESDSNHKLTPLALLRVYLLRLLFSMYDESINEIIQKATTISGKEREKDSEFNKVKKFSLFVNYHYCKDIFQYCQLSSMRVDYDEILFLYQRSIVLSNITKFFNT